MYFDTLFARALDHVAEQTRKVDVESELHELREVCWARGERDRAHVLQAAAVSPEFVEEVAGLAVKHLRRVDEQYQREHPEYVYLGDAPPDGYGERKYDGRFLVEVIDGMLDAFDLDHPETPDELAAHLLGFLLATSLPGIPRRDAPPEVIDDARKRIARAFRRAYFRAEEMRPSASSIGVSVLRALGISKDIAKSVFRTT
jgi:hypothetical protein